MRNKFKAKITEYGEGDVLVELKPPLLMSMNKWSYIFKNMSNTGVRSLGSLWCPTKSDFRVKRRATGDTALETACHLLGWAERLSAQYDDEASREKETRSNNRLAEKNARVVTSDDCGRS